MSVEEECGVLRLIKIELKIEEIPLLLQRHAARWPGATLREAEGAALRQGDFEHRQSKDFARKVIDWGKGHRFLDRFLESNEDKKISEVLRSAAQLLELDRVPESVAKAQTLNHLGQSFASKLIRFLQPHKAVILDNVLRSKLGYPETQHGYADFLNDCHSMLTLAHPKLPQLRVCDIEAALFAKVQDYRN